MSIVDSKLFVEINDLLCRFFLAFDQRDWSAMTGCLAPQIRVDYSSSGRERPSTMDGEAFVRRRQNAVDNLSKQHSFSNLQINPQAEETVFSVSCNYLILRFARSSEPVEAGEDFFHSCGSYQFLVCEIDGELKISSITQHNLRSWGNFHLHNTNGHKSAPR
ncbi:nuclear transport factor 2 family protein [Marinobacterium lutimaris]|uniref:SnoaL-like domain-containing protein n=1 Tax=Marinobacterium lutimaris TaxID=568106 RepID=A0A1H5V3K9_9GAMM|nr:nuclear transport factor 2 family protein [Marinobacterium lutimaris]SEF81823.1 SnoaL-like domain-containing protein [Marinobacterium lutimaris]